MEELRLDGAGHPLLVLVLGGNRHLVRGGVFHLKRPLETVVIRHDAFSHARKQNVKYVDKQFNVRGELESRMSHNMQHYAQLAKR